MGYIKKRQDMKKQTETIILEIEGMTCNGCATHIEKDMNATQGFLRSTVNHETGKDEFTFDADKMSEADVINAVNSVGDYSVVNNVDDEEVSAVNSKYKNQFDLIIIGGGSAAFSAAINAEGLGLTTLMVNAGLDFGGTCVNVGCVPSKNLIRAAETVHHATHSNFKGIKQKGATIDFPQL